MNKIETMMDIACPCCLNKVQLGVDQLICLECQRTYELIEGIPIMLKKEVFESNEFFEGLKKEYIKNLYNQISKSLNESLVARISQFLNFGYVQNESKHYSHPYFMNHVFNKNSIRLLGEVIGDIDLNNKDVIDVGCGRGGDIAILNKLFEPNKIIGLDISYENIAFCKKTVRKSNTFFVVGDAESLPFFSSSFDVVVNIESSLNYPNVNDFFQGVYRLLKTGGHFLYADSIPVADIQTRESYLLNLGFQMTRITNATSNILLSIEENAKRSVYSMDNNGELNLNDFLALPGSEKYQVLHEGSSAYMIYHFYKSP